MANAPAGALAEDSEPDGRHDYRLLRRHTERRRRAGARKAARTDGSEPRTGICPPRTRVRPPAGGDRPARRGAISAPDADPAAQQTADALVAKLGASIVPADAGRVDLI